MGIIERLRKRKIYHFKDQDGNTFRAIRFNHQLWALDNLKVTHFRNGDPIEFYKQDNPERAGKEPLYTAYNYSKFYGNIFGYMYNWKAIFDTRGLAPKGWRVAKGRDWHLLSLNLNYLYYRENCLKDSTIIINLKNKKIKKIPPPMNDWLTIDFSTGILKGKKYWNSPNLLVNGGGVLDILPGGLLPENGGFSGLFECIAFWGCWKSNNFDETEFMPGYPDKYSSDVIKFCHNSTRIEYGTYQRHQFAYVRIIKDIKEPKELFKFDQ